MKICLFDWNEGGHHAEIAAAWARALDPGAEVVLAAPDTTIEAVAAETEPLRLGKGKPRPGSGPGTSKEELAEAELDLVERIVSEVRPDHLVLLWADPVLRWFLSRAPMPTKISIYLFFAPFHYRRHYGSPISRRDQIRALYKEWNVMRWRRRRDAHALFGLDPIAVRRWSRLPGVPVHFVPEVPLSVEPPDPVAERNGCLLFGYLDERKGIDRIADALEGRGEGLTLRFHGEPAPEYRAELEYQIGRLRESGATVETRLERLPYEEGLAGLAAARVAFLSFGWTPPGSRVLLEAAAVGTPVIGSNLGAVAHLIRENHLGLAVDPEDPRLLGDAIRELALDPDAPTRYGPDLAAYARLLNGEHYRREIRTAFNLPADGR